MLLCFWSIKYIKFCCHLAKKSYNILHFEIGKDEKEDAETIVVLPHISNISEDSLSPDIWQNIVCDDDFDNDYCGKEQLTTESWNFHNFMKVLCLTMWLSLTRFQT